MLTGKQKVLLYQKIIVIRATVFAVSFLYNDIMKLAKIDTENLMDSFGELSTHKAAELAKSGSGLNISQYPLAFKLFTFWFLPLFVDAPSAIGMVVSFENLFCLALAGNPVNIRFVNFMIRSSEFVKINAVILFSVSYALSGTLSNLGIIIEKKSMVIYFLLFIILLFFVD